MTYVCTYVWNRVQGLVDGMAWRKSYISNQAQASRAHGYFHYIFADMIYVWYMIHVCIKMYLWNRVQGTCTGDGLWRGRPHLQTDFRPLGSDCQHYRRHPQSGLALSCFSISHARALSLSFFFFFLLDLSLGIQESTPRSRACLLFCSLSLERMLSFGVFFFHISLV